LWYVFVADSIVIAFRAMRWLVTRKFVNWGNKR
jgi:hypothetical protein